MSIEIYEGPEGRRVIDLAPIEEIMQAAESGAEVLRHLEAIKKLDEHQVERLAGLLLLALSDKVKAYNNCFNQQHLEFLQWWLPLSELMEKHG